MRTATRLIKSDTHLSGGGLISLELVIDHVLRILHAPTQGVASEAEDPQAACGLFLLTADFATLCRASQVATYTVGCRRSGHTLSLLSRLLASWYTGGERHLHHLRLGQGDLAAADRADKEGEVAVGQLHRTVARDHCYQRHPHHSQPADALDAATQDCDIAGDIDNEPLPYEEQI